ncbi:MAG TPA: trimeric intracellular cation channel family protein [Alphaproteobacteria bacterium]|nr:trimeric intracellular cation channel family protein [Alphaproteobacteria bacterium]
MDLVLTFLDYFGVVVFAVTGCLVAARRRVDIVGFALLGTVTGIGGGTIRDLLLGKPVFWVEAPLYLILCAGTACFMFFGARWMVGWRARAILWADAVGLGVFTIIGTRVGIEQGASFPVCVLTGIMTATFGGIIRDLLSAEPTLVLRKEVYVTACFCGAIVFWAMERTGVSETFCIPASFLTTFGIRSLALWKGLALPGYGSARGETDITDAASGP